MCGFLTAHQTHDFDDVCGLAVHQMHDFGLTGYPFVHVFTVSSAVASCQVAVFLCMRDVTEQTVMSNL